MAWKSDTPCAVEGCDIGLHAKDYCRRHYERWRKSGDPLKTAGFPVRSALRERFDFIGWDILDSGCWKWRGHLNDFGYGRITLDDGTYSLVHRAAYILNHGSIPEGLWIRHRCDFGSCVNPDHLEPGTAQDNMDDQVARGRKAVGEQVSNSKLTAPQVIEMRRRRALGETLTSLAKAFGITKGTVSSICRGRSWAWLNQSQQEYAAA